MDAQAVPLILDIIYFTTFLTYWKVAYVIFLVFFFVRKCIIVKQITILS